LCRAKLRGKRERVRAVVEIVMGDVEGAADAVVDVDGQNGPNEMTIEAAVIAMIAVIGIPRVPEALGEADPAEVAAEVVMTLAVVISLSRQSDHVPAISLAAASIGSA
jgi:hypothetical protein